MLESAKRVKNHFSALHQPFRSTDLLYTESAIVLEEDLNWAIPV